LTDPFYGDNIINHNTPEVAYNSMSDIRYTFHGVPKPPACDPSLMPHLAKKLCALAITAPSNVAFGGVSPTQDQETNLRMCLDQLSNPRGQLYICAKTPDGSLARASAYVKAASKDDQPIRFNEHLLLEGEWVGACAGFGPLAPSEYKLPSIALPPHIRNNARLWHTGQSYFVPAHQGGSLYKNLVEELSGFLVRDTRKHCDSRPAYCLARGTTAANGDPSSRLVKYFEKNLGFVLVGWTSAATRRIANRATTSDWPSPAEDPAFYGDCSWAVLELLLEVDDVGAKKLTGSEKKPLTALL
jgi:hypothetical protein